jgi:hypothetical protein
MLYVSTPTSNISENQPRGTPILKQARARRQATAIIVNSILKAKMQRSPEYLEQARVRFANTTRTLIIPLRTNSFATYSVYSV